MDSTSSSSPDKMPATPTAAERAAAAQAALRRLGSPKAKAPNEKEQFAQERELRQKFRRMIDPAIIRPNSDKVASLAMQVRLLISLAYSLPWIAHDQTPRRC
jgi:hypothetical protein